MIRPRFHLESGRPCTNCPFPLRYCSTWTAPWPIRRRTWPSRSTKRSNTMAGSPCLSSRSGLSFHTAASALIRLGFGMPPEAPGFEERRQYLLKVYEEHLCRETRLFDGIPEVLDTLDARGIGWGVVTNKPAWLTDPLMQGLDLATRTPAIVSGDTLHPPQTASGADSVCLQTAAAANDRLLVCRGRGTRHAGRTGRRLPHHRGRRSATSIRKTLSRTGTAISISTTRKTCSAFCGRRPMTAEFWGFPNAETPPGSA